MVKNPVPPIRRFFRANFIAGLFVALPVGITVVSLLWLWNRLDGPLGSILGFTRKAGGSWGRVVGAIQQSDYQQLLVPFLGLCVLIIAVLVLGIVTRSIIGRTALRFLESLVARVPLVGVLYTSVKQLAQAFISSDAKVKFQSAVLVQFPMKETWCIGFVTGAAIPPLANTAEFSQKESGPGADPASADIVTVFVPTTPFPTQGYTLIVPRHKTRELPVSVEDALKLVISGGIIAKPPEKKSKSEETGKRPPALAAPPRNPTDA